MIVKIVIIISALLVLLISDAAMADCANMQRLAETHSRDMARRHSLDHISFERRARRGARAENVAIASNREQAMRLWRASPLHAANMMRPGCKAVANSGRYWTMEIGSP